MEVLREICENLELARSDFDSQVHHVGWQHRVQQHINDICGAVESKHSVDCKALFDRFKEHRPNTTEAEFKIREKTVHIVIRSCQL